MSFKSMWIVLVVLALALDGNASNVNEMTSGNFDTVTNSNNVWIMEFYSPTCPHCLDFAPEYEQVGNALEGTNIKVGRIDGVHNDRIAEKYHIHGYPTVKLFRPHSAMPEDYNGPRKASTIVETAKALAQGPQDKKIRSFGDAYLNLPQTLRVPSSGGSSQSANDDW